MTVKEILSKSILSKSQIYDYAVNPYIGCSHSCAYCYAAYMGRYTGHKERWGDFVDVKINASELLAKEIKKKHMGQVWVSGVCDPYQPLEQEYQLTKRCLEILVARRWPVVIQTKSPLVVRDISILEKAKDIEVGFSIATADEGIRKLLEPGAPPIKERINALGILHSRGIKTFAMIAPILPGAAALVNDLAGKVDYVLVGRLNYHYADRLYKQSGMEWAKEDQFFMDESDKLKKGFESAGMPVTVQF
jgi:DNA repair photolyase